MANYQLNYTGAEFNTLLGKINSIETLLNSTAITLNNTVSQTTTNSNNITALYNNAAYETTGSTISDGGRIRDNMIYISKV